jgi:outer membrane protein assembly factor BamB
MTRLILLALIAVLTSGCALFRDKDNAEPPAPLVEFSPSLKVETLWSRGVGAGMGKRELKLVPALDADRIFVADWKGLVSAVETRTGNRLWETHTDEPVSAGPGTGDGLVLVGTRDGVVVALDQDSGNERWRATVTSEILAPPQAAMGVTVVRSVDGRLFGLNSDNGKRLWTYERAVPVLTLRGTSTPVIAGDLVLNGFDSGRVVAVTLRKGKPVWDAAVTVPRGRTEIERMVDVDADPVVVGDIVYVVTFQGRIAALELRTGRVLWHRDMSSYAGIAADSRNIYVSDDRSHVWALDRYSSASLWRQSELQGRAVTAPAVVGEYVVVGDYQGYVHWLAREDGRFLARVRVDGDGIAAAPVVAGDTVYVYGKGGVLAALRALPAMSS